MGLHRAQWDVHTEAEEQVVFTLLRVESRDVGAVRFDDTLRKLPLLSSYGCPACACADTAATHHAIPSCHNRTSLRRRTCLLQKGRSRPPAALPYASGGRGPCFQGALWSVVLCHGRDEVGMLGRGCPGW